MTRRLFLTVTMLLLLLNAADVHQVKGFEDHIKLDVKPVAVAYSTKASQISIANAHYALMTVQYSLLLAGIPYAVLSEERMRVEDLSKYSCLIFPSARWLNLSENFIDKLDKWVRSGGALISFGVPVVKRGGFTVYSYEWMNFYSKVFGLLHVSSRTGKLFSVISESHMITRDFTGEIMLEDKSYDYLVLGSTSNASILLRSNLGDILAAASKYGHGRVVLFTLQASDSLFQKTSLLLRSIQWGVFGEYIPIGLNLACGRVIWMLNVDADWSAEKIATGKALRWLLNESEKACFPFSWALITGNYSGLKKQIDWLSLKDLFEASIDAGVEFASHTVHHPIWVNVTGEEKILFELKQSYKDIAGNLTEVEGFQVPDGMFPIEYYFLVKKAGYKYLVQTFAYPFLHMMGAQPLEDGSEIFVFWRSTKSDFYYFDYSKNSPEAALKTEKENFNRFYALGHSAPYILLWHDYSLINETRLKVFLEVLRYEYAERLDVSPMTAGEFIRRFEAWRRIRLKVTYMPKGVDVQVDVSDVPQKYLQYTSCMCLRIDGEQIGYVEFMNRAYPLFSDDYVILPELSRGVYEFKIRYGKPRIPHVAHVTSCRLLSATIENRNVFMNISRLWDNRARICGSKDLKIFVNGTEVSLETCGDASIGYVTFKAVEIPKEEIEASEYLKGFLIGLIVMFLLAVLILLIKRRY